MNAHDFSAAHEPGQDQQEEENGFFDEEQDPDPLTTPVVLQQEGPESPSSTPSSSRAASPSPLALSPPPHVHPATPEPPLSPLPHELGDEPGPPAPGAALLAAGAHAIQDPANRAQFFVDGHFPTRDFRIEGYSVGTPGVREISVMKLRSLFEDEESAGRYLLRYYMLFKLQIFIFALLLFSDLAHAL